MIIRLFRRLFRHPLHNHKWNKVIRETGFCDVDMALNMRIEYETVQTCETCGAVKTERWLSALDRVRAEFEPERWEWKECNQIGVAVPSKYPFWPLDESGNRLPCRSLER